VHDRYIDERRGQNNNKLIALAFYLIADERGTACPNSYITTVVHSFFASLFVVPYSHGRLAKDLLDALVVAKIVCHKRFHMGAVFC
jgi:hypothetical protein